jgi:hypothetical protein
MHTLRMQSLTSDDRVPLSEAVVTGLIFQNITKTSAIQNKTVKFPSMYRIQKKIYKQREIIPVMLLSCTFHIQLPILFFYYAVTELGKFEISDNCFSKLSLTLRDSTVLKIIS